MQAQILQAPWDGNRGTQQRQKAVRPHAQGAVLRVSGVPYLHLYPLCCPPPLVASAPIWAQHFIFSCSLAHGCTPCVASLSSPAGPFLSVHRHALLSSILKALPSAPSPPVTSSPSQQTSQTHPHCLSLPHFPFTPVPFTCQSLKN